jgi:hypothetical protein
MLYNDFIKNIKALTKDIILPSDINIKDSNKLKLIKLKIDAPLDEKSAFDYFYKREPWIAPVEGHPKNKKDYIIEKLPPLAFFGNGVKVILYSMPEFIHLVWLGNSGSSTRTFLL